MKLRFRVGRKEGSKQARKNGDIEALADAMRALKNPTTKEIWPDCVLPRKSVLAERPVGGVAQTNVIWRLGINLRSPKTFRLSILHAN